MRVDLLRRQGILDENTGTSLGEGSHSFKSELRGYKESCSTSCENRPEEPKIWESECNLVNSQAGTQVSSSIVSCSVAEVDFLAIVAIAIGKHVVPVVFEVSPRLEAVAGLANIGTRAQVPVRF